MPSAQVLHCSTSSTWQVLEQQSPSPLSGTQVLPGHAASEVHAWLPFVPPAQRPPVSHVSPTSTIPLPQTATVPASALGVPLDQISQPPAAAKQANSAN